MNNFASFSLPKALLEHLTQMGFAVPTPIQAQGIPEVLAGKDLLGLAPTGTGKTGAFGIPTMANLTQQTEKQVLVVAPTRELAAQIFEFMLGMARKLKLRGGLLVGGESFHRQFLDCKAGVDFIVATPGRLMDHVNRGLDLKHVGILVLDEVDQMLDMGFAPQVEEIVKRVPDSRQTLFFSATMPPAIQQLTQRYLKSPVQIKVAATAAQAQKRKEEKLKVYGPEKPKVLLQQIEAYPGKILVFARTQRGAQNIVHRLEDSGVEAACLHGGRTQMERKRALEAFRRGRVRVMVATDIAARGIDVPDIETVINYDAPATKEDYTHRIGRTARCGKEGLAITFIDDTSQVREPRRVRRPNGPSKFHPSGKRFENRGPRRGQLGVQPKRQHTQPQTRFAAKPEAKFAKPEAKLGKPEAKFAKQIDRPVPLPKAAEAPTPVALPKPKFQAVAPRLDNRTKPFPMARPSEGERPENRFRNFRKEKLRQTRENHSGSVRFFRAGNAPAVRPNPRPGEKLAEASAQRWVPDWIRGKQSVRRPKGPELAK